MEGPLYLSVVKRQPQPSGWGTPLPLLHESIADIPEKELIARVLTDSHYRHTLLSIKDLTFENAYIGREIELRRFRGELAGDVDILVVPREAPDESTAIQVKRFKAKVSIDDAHAGHPERMRALFAKGVEQANELARIGFSQVYLWIFIAVDTREQNRGRYTYDGADHRGYPDHPKGPSHRSPLDARIRNAISPAGLNLRVGLMTAEWVQPMDRAPFELGTYSGQLMRLAERACQPSELTAWLQTVAAQNG